MSIGDFCKGVWNGVTSAAFKVGHWGVKGAASVITLSAKASSSVCKGEAFLAEKLRCERAAAIMEHHGEAIEQGAKGVENTLVAGLDTVAAIPIVAIDLVTGNDGHADELGLQISGAINDARDNFDAACEHEKAAVDNFVGEAQFNAVKREYEEFVDENKGRIAELTRERAEISQEVNKKLEAINQHKEESKILFDRFSQISKKIADWDIGHYETIDYFIAEPVSPMPLKSTAELFKDIDFDNDPIWSRIKGAFTLGLLTVSQVKDVEVKIHGYKRAAESKWAEDQEINKKYRVMLSSLEFVNDTFELFIPFYKKLQAELVYALSAVEQVMALRDMYYFSGMQGNVNPYFLPKHHLNILMACDKLTRILCKMTRLHYVSAGAKEPTAIAADIESVKEWRAKDFAALEELEAA